MNANQGSKFIPGMAIALAAAGLLLGAAMPAAALNATEAFKPALDAAVEDSAREALDLKLFLHRAGMSTASDATSTNVAKSACDPKRDARVGSGPAIKEMS